MPKSQSGLRFRLLSRLVATTATVQILLGGYQYLSAVSQSSQQLKKEEEGLRSRLEASLQQAMARLQLGLANSLYNVSLLDLKNILKGEMLDDAIGFALVYDEKEKIVAAFERDEKGQIHELSVRPAAWQPSHTTALRYGDEAKSLGRLELKKSEAGLNRQLALSRARYQSAEVDQLIGILGQVVIVGATLGFVMHMLLKRLLSRPLQEAAESLNCGSRTIIEASETLDATSRKLVGLNEEQAQAVQETATSVEELLAMVKNTTQTALRTVEMTNEMIRLGGGVMEAVKNLDDAMNRLEASSEGIRSLVKIVEDVGKQTEIINEIAFQTKILSFNAAVEAERAGEHGRGFAVVAQEVSNLAQVSSKAAKEIQDIVKASIGKTDAITSSNQHEFSSGRLAADQIRRVMTEMVDNSKLVAAAIQENNRSAQEQKAGFTQISDAMNLIDQGVQRTLECAESNAEISASLRQQIDKLIEIDQSLQGLSA